MGDTPQSINLLHVDHETALAEMAAPRYEKLGF